MLEFIFSTCVENTLNDRPVEGEKEIKINNQLSSFPVSTDDFQLLIFGLFAVACLWSLLEIECQ
jgi:hypothetical protein